MSIVDQLKAAHRIITADEGLPTFPIGADPQEMYNHIDEWAHKYGWAKLEKVNDEEFKLHLKGDRDHAPLTVTWSPYWTAEQAAEEIARQSGGKLVVIDVEVDEGPSKALFWHDSPHLI